MVITANDMQCLTLSHNSMQNDCHGNCSTFLFSTEFKHNNNTISQNKTESKIKLSWKPFDKERNIFSHEIIC